MLTNLPIHLPMKMSALVTSVLFTPRLFEVLKYSPPISSLDFSCLEGKEPVALCMLRSPKHYCGSVTALHGEDEKPPFINVCVTLCI